MALIASISVSFGGENDLYAYQETPDDYWGFCDYWGNVIIPPRYDNVDSHNPISEFMAVKLSGYWFFVNKSRIENRNKLYLRAENFHFGLAPVLDRNTNKWGLINTEGEYVIQPQYDGFNWLPTYWIARKKNSMGKTVRGFINWNGKVIALPQFDDLHVFSEGMAAVKRNGKWGYIDENGNLAIDFKFDYASEFSEGLASVKNGGKIGCIDKTGKYVIEPVLNGCSKFVNGLAPAKSGEKWGLIDKTGKFVVSPQYDATQDISEGLVGVKLNGKWGFIDTTGKMVIQPEFEWAKKFVLGNALVMSVINPTNNFKAYGLINKSGLYSIMPEYEIIGDFYDGIARARMMVISNGKRMSGKEGYIDLSGNFYSNLREALKAVHRR